MSERDPITYYFMTCSDSPPPTSGPQPDAAQRNVIELRALLIENGCFQISLASKIERPGPWCCLNGPHRRVVGPTEETNKTGSSSLR